MSDSAARTPEDALARTLGIEILEASPERVVGTMQVKRSAMPAESSAMPAEGGGLGGDGPLPGGASCVLAEALGTAGARLHAGPGRDAVSIELNATYHRPPAAGPITGVASRVHGGRTLAGYEIVITDERQGRVCTARLTCVLRDDP